MTTHVLINPDQDTALTFPTRQDAEDHLMSFEQRVDLLAKLIEWADSEAGSEYRAQLAAHNRPSPVTANDVVAVLDDTNAEAMREMFDL